MNAAMHSNDDLQRIRRRAMAVIVSLAWVNAPIAGVLAFMTGNDATFVTLVTAMLAALVTFAPQLAGQDAGRSVALVGLQGQAAMIVAAMAGHGWQVDGHMYFSAL